MPPDVTVLAAGSRQTIPLERPRTVTDGAAADKALEGVASKRPLANPSFHVDLALNLVVLQFVDDKGDVTSSIPSEKQLKAYRDQAGGAATPSGHIKTR